MTPSSREPVKPPALLLGVVLVVFSIAFVLRESSALDIDALFELKSSATSLESSVSVPTNPRGVIDAKSSFTVPRRGSPILTPSISRTYTGGPVVALASLAPSASNTITGAPQPPEVDLTRRKLGRYNSSMPQWPPWPPAEFVASLEADFQVAQKTSIGSDGRSHSVPIITGDGFRSISDIACDLGCDAADVRRWVQSNSQSVPIIFVVGHHIESFLSVALPVLRNHSARFVLVVHNSDAAVPGQVATDAALLDEPLLVACFAQNAEVQHPRLFPIPIGFENRYNRFGAHPDALIRGCRIASTTSPSRRVLSAFNGASYGKVRGPLAAKSHALGFDIVEAEGVSAMSQDEWYATLSEYSLVLCPRGNGLDTHRAWDTLYLGRIPVVVSSPMDAAFDGLPVIILASWDEIDDLPGLERREAEVVRGMTSGAFDMRRLHFDYFGCRILAAAGRATPTSMALSLSCPPAVGKGQTVAE